MMLVDRRPILFYSLVWLTVVFALFIAIVKLPAEAILLRPELVCLLVMYWVINHPHQFGVTFGFSCGLMQDVIQQVVWGAHAFALAVVAYICLNAWQRIKSYSIWHQTLWVAILIGMHQVCVNWVQGVAGYHVAISSLLASVVVSTLLWPPLALVLKRYRLSFRMI